MSENLLTRCTTPMATVLTAIFLIGTSGPQARSAEPAAKETQSDQDRLQGVWIIVTLTEKQEDRLLISGDRMYWYVGQKTLTGTITVDATKTPKHFDLTIREEKGRTVTHRGIYQFRKGGWLFLNLVDVNSPRPTDFKGDKFKEGESKLMFVRTRPEEALKEIKTGTYTATVKGDEWTLHLNKKGRITVKKKGHVVFEGTFIATKTELIVFRDPQIRLACKKNTKTGKYKWKLDGKTLSFTKHDDDCIDREMAITQSEWMRKD